jgi:hypothetical protein
MKSPLASNKGVGAPEFSEKQIEAMEDAFRAWHGEYFNILEEGGTGNVLQLFMALKRAIRNS